MRENFSVSILFAALSGLFCIAAALLVTVLYEKHGSFIMLLLASGLTMVFFVFSTVFANRAARIAARRKEQENKEKENRKKRLMEAFQKFS